MNKKLKISPIMAGFVLLFSSCIKQEAPNAEADILSCEVQGDLLIRQPVIENDQVKLYVNGWEDLSSLAPRFTLTPGATLTPESGTVRDFSTPQTYTVTSQDGQWQKQYTVSFLSQDAATHYHFENVRFYEYEGQRFFHIFQETITEGATMEWGSGNAGFMFTNQSAPAEDYPTSQSAEGYQGKCVRLVTRSTGPLGQIFGAPLAAGNLFTGTFEISLTSPASSTHFGVPFRRKPLALSGYYKYKAGENLTDRTGSTLSGRKDEGDIYAVFYEVTDAVPYLDGTNVKTHNNIVMIAQLPHTEETDTWKRFSIPFQAVEGRTLDPEKLRTGRYNLAIVLSSSREGASFVGAVGSTLLVDEMQLFYE